MVGNGRAMILGETDGLVKVNGKPVSADLEPRTLLVHFLRDVLELTGRAR